MSNPNRVLVIDEDVDGSRSVRDLAEETGFVVAEADSQSGLAELYRQFSPSVIVLHLGTPDLDGLECLRELARVRCTVPIITVGGLDEKLLVSIQYLGRSFGLSMNKVIGWPVQLGLLRRALVDAKIALADSPVWQPSHAEIRRAISNGELLAYFQPRVDLQHHQCPVVGSEALVRWRHPQRGIIPAADFLAAAEAAGMIATLTETMLVYVVRQLVRWEKMGLALPVWVNLSPIQLHDETLPDRVTRMLAEAKLETALLGLELSERVVRTDMNAASVLLTRLRIKGVNVGIDNFHAAHLSPSDIHHLPLDTLKLDRSLVRKIERDPDAQTVLNATIAMARELGLTVCAEGVETAIAARLLQSFGCQEAQGFHFGKPQNADEFTALLKQQKATADSRACEPFPVYI